MENRTLLLARFVSKMRIHNIEQLCLEGVMKVLCMLFVSFVLTSRCHAENILLSAATTNKELILLNIEYSNKKYTIVDHAIFNLPTQAGVTAIGRLQNGNYQVVWTAADASNKTRLNRILVDPDLNKVGNTKKFGPVLSSFVNLNIVNDSRPQNIQTTAIPITTLPLQSFEIGKEATISSCDKINGNLKGQNQKLFKKPKSVRLLDTAISPNADNIYYVSLGYIESTNQYVAFFGNTSNTEFTSAFVFTGGDILSIDVRPVPGTDDYLFFFVERLANPQRYRIAYRQFDGPTGQPVGPLKIVVNNITGDLRQLPFFNMLTVVASTIDPTGVHVFHTDLNTQGDGTDIWDLFRSTQGAGSGHQKLDISTIVSSRFIYGLDAETEKATVCLQDDNNPATKVVVDINTGTFLVQCNGLTYLAMGRITKTGSNVRLNYNSGNSTLNLNINLNTNIGTASIQPPQGAACTITDRNINNNSCNLN
jgi:hypothetical protein